MKQILHSYHHVRRFLTESHIRRTVAREGLALSGFGLAGGAWFLAFSWAVPSAYEIMARFGKHDYSYLWDGRSEQCQMIAWSGLVVVAACYGAYILWRGGQWVMARAVGHKAGRLRRWMVREVLVFLAVMIIGGVLLLSGTLSLQQYKDKAWQEAVMNKKEFQRLDPEEMAAAKFQYEEEWSVDPWEVKLVFDRYGAPVYAAYFTQWLGGWMLRFGYLASVVVRFLLWARGVVRRRARG